MATINGENLAPGPGLGLATILRPDYTPLRIMQQSDAIRARRAAADALAKQKKAAELVKQRMQDGELKLDTGGFFQEPYNDYTANAQDVIGKFYADEEAGRISTADRVKGIATYKNDLTREGLLGTDKDKFLTSYLAAPTNKDFRDRAGLDIAVGESLHNKDGSRKRAINYDELKAIQEFDANPRTYASDPIIGDYYKGLQASTIDEANAGRIGGIHSSSSLTYKGLLPVKRSDGTWDVKRDALGRPVIGTTASELDLARESNHNLNMAVSRLRLEYDDQVKQGTAKPGKSDLDLFQDASQKYVSFRQADSAGRNAQLAVGRSSKPKATDIVQDDGITTEATVPAVDKTAPSITGQVGYPLQTSEGKIGAMAPASTNPTVVNGIPTARLSKAPSLKNGKSLTVTGAQFGQLERRNSQGQLEQVDNNTERFDGTLGSAFQAARDIKTKHRIPGLTVEQQQERVRQGTAEMGLFINGFSANDKNYLRESDAIYQNLLKQNPRPGQTGYKPEIELQEQARQLAMRGSEPQIIPYTDQTRQEIDNKSQGYYKRAHEAAQLETQQLRQQAGKPTASPGGSIYKRPTTNTAAASRGGSIYKIR